MTERIVENEDDDDNDERKGRKKAGNDERKREEMPLKIPDAGRWGEMLNSILLGTLRERGRDVVLRNKKFA